MIRLATLQDVPIVAELGKLMHAEGVFSNHDYDTSKVETMLKSYVKSDEKLFLVEEDLVTDDGITGWFFANLNQHYFGNTKLAIEQCMYIHPLHRGGSTASRFMKKFEHWARYKDAKVLLFMPCNNGVDDRWSKFCHKNGYVQTGYMFTKEI